MVFAGIVLGHMLLVSLFGWACYRAGRQAGLEAADEHLEAATEAWERVQESARKHGDLLQAAHDANEARFELQLTYLEQALKSHGVWVNGTQSLVEQWREFGRIADLGEDA